MLLIAQIFSDMISACIVSDSHARDKHHFTHRNGTAAAPCRTHQPRLIATPFESLIAAFAFRRTMTSRSNPDFSLQEIPGFLRRQFQVCPRCSQRLIRHRGIRRRHVLRLRREPVCPPMQMIALADSTDFIQKLCATQMPLIQVRGLPCGFSATGKV